jgi:AhpD family alkylhydroperoxidase
MFDCYKDRNNIFIATMSRIAPKKLREYSLFARFIFYFQKKKYGFVLEPMFLWGRCPRLMKSFLAMVRAFNQRSSPLDPQLRALVSLKVSQINVCEFCVDINSAIILEHGGSAERLKELQDFEKSLMFTKKEKIALKYADLITRSPKKIDDLLFRELKDHFSDDAIVELTALIAFQNMSSKFNTALDISSPGFCLQQQQYGHRGNETDK